MIVRTFIIVIIAVLVGSAAYYGVTQFLLSPVAQEKQFVVGVITNPPSLNPARDGFWQGMKTRGYEEGKNVHYIVEVGGKDIKMAKEVAERMIAQHVDLIYVMGSIAARAVKEVTAEQKPELPVVFGVVSNPVGGKLVKSMQSSGNNLTGVTPINEIVNSKRLEVFLEMVPGIKRVIIGWSDPNTTGIENLRNAAKALKVELAEKQVADSIELKSFYNSFHFQPGDAIFRASDSASGIIINDIIAISLEKKIPLSGTNSNDVELGALMSYGANFRKIGAQAARLADTILKKGAKPSDIPIELPEEFEFVINAKTANAIGIVIPPVSINKANRIIR